MTTETTTLTAWLLEQIAADEAVAKRAGSFTPWDLDFQNDNYGHLTVQPSRILATCAAHRAIVELHPRSPYGDVCRRCDRGFWDESDDGSEVYAPDPEPYPCATIRALAGIYADRDGFDARWVG